MSTSWLIAGKTLAFACTIAIPLLLVRRMAQHDFGLYKQIFLVVNSAVTMLPLGFGMTAYYFLPREEEGGRARTVFNILLFTVAITVLVGLVLSLFPAVLVLLFKEPASVRFAPSIALVVCLWVVGSLLDIVVVANQEIRLASALIVASQATRATLFVAAALVRGTVGALLIAAICQGVAQVAVLLVYVRSRFPGFWRAFDRHFLSGQLAYAIPFGAAGFLYSLQTDLHNYVVSHWYGAAAFAVYSIGCFQLPLFGILAESVSSVLIPRFSGLERQHDPRAIAQLAVQATRKLALVYFPAYAFLMIVRREFIVALFTDRYLASVPVFAINLTLIPLGIFIIDPVLRAHMEHRHFTMKLHASVLISLALALPIVIGRYGLLGAISAVVAFSGIGRFAGLLKVARILNVKLRDLVVGRDLAKVAAAASVAVVVTIPVRALMIGHHRAFDVVVFSALWFGASYAVAVLGLGAVTVEERDEVRLWLKSKLPYAVSARLVAAPHTNPARSQMASSREKVADVFHRPVNADLTRTGTARAADPMR